MAVVLDLFARQILGLALSNKPDAELVIKELDEAYVQRGRSQGLLFHADQGSPNPTVASFANGFGVTECAKA